MIKKTRFLLSLIFLLAVPHLLSGQGATSFNNGRQGDRQQRSGAAWSYRGGSSCSLGNNVRGCRK